MLTLVEPFKATLLEDRPDLGVASLIASCQEKGFHADLIKGQTRFFIDFLENGFEEFIGILGQLKTEEKQKVSLVWFEQKLNQSGEREVKQSLKECARVLKSNNLSEYLQPKKSRERAWFFYAFMDAQKKFLQKYEGQSTTLIEKTLQEIKRTKPEIVGFSLYDSVGEVFISRLAKRVKSDLDVPVVLGGALASKMSPFNLTRLFKQLPIDFALRGQADLTLPILLANQPGRLKDIPNLVYRSDSKILFSPVEYLKQNELDLLPVPDFSQFELDYYNSPVRLLPLRASQGCYWNRCAFCADQTLYGDRYHPYPIKRLLETIAIYREKYRSDFIMFHDQAFPPNIAKSLSREVIKAGHDHLYFCSWQRLDRGFLEEGLLELMYQAGFRQILWGLESGSQRVLDLMNKGTRLSNASAVLRQSHEAGLRNICFVIIGFPGETTSDLDQTKDFLFKHRQFIDSVSFSTFKLEKNTPIGFNPGQFGIKIENDLSEDDVKFSNLSKNGVGEAEKHLFAEELSAIEFSGIRLKGFQPSMYAVLAATTFKKDYAAKLLLEKKIGRLIPFILAEKESERALRLYGVGRAEDNEFVIDQTEAMICSATRPLGLLENILKRVEKKTGFDSEQVTNVTLDLLLRLNRANGVLFFDHQKLKKYGSL